MKNKIIIILSILVGILSWEGCKGFTSNPTPFEQFSAIVFVFNMIFIITYLWIEIE